jgi:hypothetical protein
MPYRQTDNVVRKLAARQDAILAAARCRGRGRHGGGADRARGPARRHRCRHGLSVLSSSPISWLRSRLRSANGRWWRSPRPPARRQDLSALSAAVTTLRWRALAQRRLAYALLAEPVEPEIAAARASYRQALAAELETLIRKAVIGGHLPDQDAALAAAAVVRRDRGLDRAAGASAGR